MANLESTSRKATEVIAAVKESRDRARVQAHLFSLDARKRWEVLEGALRDLQAKLEQSGEEIAEGALNKLRALTHTARELMRELDGTLELETPVRKVMKRAPVTCALGDPLARAAQMMWELDCGAVPVVDADGRVLGILTDRDVCMAAYTRGQTLGTMSVESAMSRDIHTCSPEDSLGHAVRLMAEKQIRRLPVIEDGKLVGLVTLADVARDVRKHERAQDPACVALAHAVAAISEPRAVVPGQARPAAG